MGMTPDARATAARLEFISHRMTFETNELEHEVPCHSEATQANRSSRQWLPCMLSAPFVTR